MKPNQHIEALLANAIDAITLSSTPDELEHCRIQYLGKKGQLTLEFLTLKKLPKEQVPTVGKALNTAKKAIEAALVARKTALQMHQDTVDTDIIDVTLPGRRERLGALHPVTLASQSLSHIFSCMGFTVVEGPEVEDDYYNFTALNIPSHHPARAMHDTFYLPGGLLLRTHTSPVQIRVMEKTSPPIYMITPGRVYRRDSDLTHTPMFHQLEGLIIDESVSFAHLRGLLEVSLEAFFEQPIRCRFRPSYFPFTEPSAELDITCFYCHSKGCRTCKQTGWIEVLGCGVVHPHVLKEVNVDGERYIGLAFGMGIDRLAMLKYGIPDLRALFENDLRMLACFSEA